MPIFYNALLLTGVNLTLRMVSTSFQVYLSGKIGPAGIGLLQLVLSVAGLTTTAGIAGIRTATMYLTAEELGRRRPNRVVWVLSGAFAYSMVFSSTVAGLVSAFAPQIATHWIGDIHALPAIRLFAAFLPVTCLCAVMTGYFTAANRIATLAAVEVSEQVCAMSITVLALFFWAGSDPAKACLAVIGGSCAGALLTLVCLIMLRLWERPTIGPTIPIARRLANTALPLAVADDLKAGISTAENLMVPKRLALYDGTSNSLALFGMVCGMVFPILMFPAAILFGLTELLVPEMARCNAAGSRHRIDYLMRRSLRLALFYSLSCSGILYLCADKLCVGLYQSTQAGTYLRWFAPLAVMLYCDIVTDAMIKGLGQQKASVRYNILTSTMDVALLFLLLPKYGINGYFFSFLVTHLINFILSLSRLLRITGKKLTLWPPLYALFSAIISVWVSTHLSSPTQRCCAFLALLFSQLSIFGVISKEDLRWIRGLIKPK